MNSAPDQSPLASGSHSGCIGANTRWVVFSLDAHRYAVALSAVERIVRAAEVTPLPRAPSLILGVIEIGGRVLPVFNTRRRFGLRERAIEPGDQFLIARVASRPVVLVIDAAQGLIEGAAESPLDAAVLAPDLDHIRGAIHLEEGLVLIHDPEAFLPGPESRELARALDAGAVHGG